MSEDRSWESRSYVEKLPPGIHTFPRAVRIVRFGNNVCLLAMNPPLFVVEENLGYLPGATPVAIKLESFSHQDEGVVIHATVTYASWWRRSAPALYQRREYGGPRGWPTREQQRAQKRWWLGFPR